jgi:peroxiredoxin Q/BCP
MLLDEGVIAPDFELPDENGVSNKLSDYHGKSIILYFYPKDNTSGCTKEAVGFRDDFDFYKKHQVIILGVSPDTPKRHTNFKEKYDLPFTLLADTEHRVSELYGVWQKKKMAGREYYGIKRTTYLIGSDGKIIKVFKKVKPAEHSKEIIEYLKGLGLN